MKGLVLATCVGSAAAVVAPQFQNAFYAGGGNCCCQDGRLHQMFGVALTQQNSPNVTKFTATIGNAPGDFYVRDIVVSSPPASIWPGWYYTQPVGGRILVNGQLLCNLATEADGYTGHRRLAGLTSFSDGVLIPAGHTISVEFDNDPGTIMLAGRLR